MATTMERLEAARNPEPRILSEWTKYELNESAWTVLVAQLYRRTMVLRQVPFQLSQEELESFGPPPSEPDYPEEPAKNSETWLAWSMECATIRQAWEHQLSRWTEARQEASAGWDLTPLPEWEPVSSLPSHLQTWVPVQRWEQAVQRAQSVVPRVETKWTQRWDPKAKAFVQVQETTSKQATVTTESRVSKSLGTRFVAMPETLVLVVPTIDLPEFYKTSQGGILILARVGFASRDGKIAAEPVPGSELILNTPALDIRVAACVEDPLGLPMVHYRGMHLPQSWKDLDAIRGGGPTWPIPRNPSVANPATSVEAKSVPSAWWSLAELNCCVTESFERSCDGPFWRPILAPRKGREQQEMGAKESTS